MKKALCFAYAALAHTEFSPPSVRDIKRKTADTLCTGCRFTDYVSVSRRSANGTDFSTGAAVYTSIGIDLILAVALSDSASGALTCTSTAGNAIIGNFVSHRKSLLLIISDIIIPSFQENAILFYLISTRYRREREFLYGYFINPLLFYGAMCYTKRYDCGGIKLRSRKSLCIDTG